MACACWTQVANVAIFFAMPPLWWFLMKASDWQVQFHVNLGMHDLAKESTLLEKSSTRESIRPVRADISPAPAVRAICCI